MNQYRERGKVQAFVSLSVLLGKVKKMRSGSELKAIQDDGKKEFKVFDEENSIRSDEESSQRATGRKKREKLCRT